VIGRNNIRFLSFKFKKDRSVPYGQLIAAPTWNGKNSTQPGTEIFRPRLGVYLGSISSVWEETVRPFLL
jgi:hypothetical protein